MKKIAKNKKPKITDWIQAMAAAISIPAAIIAFITFFHKDKVLQSQINSLDTISRQSIIQTKILANQVGLLEDELEFQKKQNETYIANRKTEIEPKLVLELEESNFGYLSARFINNGKPARIIAIKEKKGNNFLVALPFEYIGEGKEKGVTFLLKNPDKREKLVLDFTLVYQDIDKKIHMKDFHFDNIEKFMPYVQ